MDKWKTIPDQRQIDIEPEAVRRAVRAEYLAGVKAYRQGAPACNGNGKPHWQAGWLAAEIRAAERAARSNNQHQGRAK